jgi:hypothetical protein
MADETVDKDQPSQPVSDPNMVSRENFDADAYLRDNPDVAAAIAQGRFNRDPYLHYVQYGYQEGRKAMPKSSATAATTTTTTTNGDSGNAYGTKANLNSEYLTQQVKAAFAKKGVTNPSQSDIDYWVNKAKTPEMYSDGKVRVGWNPYWETRLVTGQASADPGLAGDEGVLDASKYADIYSSQRGGGGEGMTMGDFGNMANYPGRPGLLMPDRTTAALPERPSGYQLPPSFDYSQELPTFEPPTAETLANDPAYQFRLQQGQQALEQSAAAKGTLRGGATLKSLQDYAQGMASQEYQNAYARALQEYQNKVAAQQTGYGQALGAYQANLQPGQFGATLGQQQYGTDVNAALQNQQLANQANQFYNSLIQQGYSQDVANALTNQQMGNQVAQFGAGYGLNSAQQAFNNQLQMGLLGLNAAQLFGGWAGNYGQGMYGSQQNLGNIGAAQSVYGMNPWLNWMQNIPASISAMYGIPPSNSATNKTGGG